MKGSNKMKKENYKDRPPKDDVIFDLDINNSVSAYEFTGMLPVPPRSESEKESYMDIQNYSPESVDIFGKHENKI